MSRYKLIPIIFLIVLLLGCVTNKKMNGLWETEGYGYIMELDNGRIKKLYEKTSISLLEIESEEINEVFKSELLDDGRILLTSVYTSLTAIKKESLPVFKNESEDPVYNFDVFWNSFNEQYAFMEEKNIDWTDIYNKYRPQITEFTTDKELFNYMIEMIEPLADSHVNLINPEGRSWDNPSGHMGKFLRNASIFDILAVIQNYLVDDTDFKKTANDKILYGKMRNNCGYICILSSEGFAYGSYKDEMNVLENSMDEVLDYLQDCESIVLDNRFNQGGYDEAMLRVASRFAQEKTLAYTKKARNGNSYTNEIPKYIDPEERRIFTNKFTKVLTSPVTVSAGEILVLAMRSLPNTEVIGMRTSGSLSDLLYKQLPNGWVFSLSNEVYISHDNISFENKGIIGEGIIPDRIIDLNIGGFINNNSDSILSIALE